VRAGLCQSQEEFALMIGVNVATLLAPAFEAWCGIT
jgi:hypothetical protein